MTQNINRKKYIVMVTRVTAHTYLVDSKSKIPCDVSMTLIRMGFIYFFITFFLLPLTSTYSTQRQSIIIIEHNLEKSAKVKLLIKVIRKIKEDNVINVRILRLNKTLSETLNKNFLKKHYKNIFIITTSSYPEKVVKKSLQNIYQQDIFNSYEKAKLRCENLFFFIIKKNRQHRITDFEKTLHAKFKTKIFPDSKLLEILPLINARIYLLPKVKMSSNDETKKITLDSSNLSTNCLRSSLKYVKNLSKYILISKISKNTKITILSDKSYPKNIPFGPILCVSQNKSKTSEKIRVLAIDYKKPNIKIETSKLYMRFPRKSLIVEKVIKVQTDTNISGISLQIYVKDYKGILPRFFTNGRMWTLKGRKFTLENYKGRALKINLKKEKDNEINLAIMGNSKSIFSGSLRLKRGSQVLTKMDIQLEKAIFLNDILGKLIQYHWYLSAILLFVFAIIMLFIYKKTAASKSKITEGKADEYAVLIDKPGKTTITRTKNPFQCILPKFTKNVIVKVDKKKLTVIINSNHHVIEQLPSRLEINSDWQLFLEATNSIDVDEKLPFRLILSKQ